MNYYYEYIIIINPYVSLDLPGLARVNADSMPVYIMYNELLVEYKYNVDTMSVECKHNVSRM